MSADQKQFDLIVFGATSFVGKILAYYLCNEVKEQNLSWAMAARSSDKLKALKSSLGESAIEVATIVADASDKASLLALCEKTSVIVSTVGPYALYGELLVNCCAITGTDYCDLTGEAHWIRRMILRYEHLAKESGARIVNSCGFDSIPSDLGVAFLQAESLSEHGSYCSSVKMRVKDMKGGASGGTIASGVNLYKEAAGNPELQSELRDYYSLCPTDFESKAIQHHPEVEFDSDLDSWAGPFVMAAINTRIVLRTNAIRQSGVYSSHFKYDEGLLTGSGSSGRNKAWAVSIGTKLGTGALSVGPMRNFLVNFVLPKPGEGPSAQQQENGSYDLRFIGTTDDQQKVSVKVTGDRDPGYGSTAKMLGQAAISLCKDVSKTEVEGGFWTPGAIFDERLIKRLENYAGITFERV